MHPSREAIIQRVTPITLEKFCTDIINQDWSHIFLELSPDKAYDTFIACFKNIYKRNFPYRKIKNKRKIRKPCLSPELLHTRNTRNNIFKKFIKTENFMSLSNYKHNKNQLNNEIKKAINSTYRNIFREENSRDNGWKHLSNLLHPNRKFVARD